MDDEQKKLEYLRRRMEVLDRVIDGLETLAAQSESIRLNLAPSQQRLYRCDDRGFKDGRLRHTRHSSSLGANFGRS
jgi:hypothetical protein